MSEYLSSKKLTNIPRIPLEGKLDLTYHCNNDCLHCWVRIPSNKEEGRNELSFDEIRTVVDEARKMGCQKWSISGGEPMLRQDFSGIIDYITRHSLSYSLNTNGTLITPKIARLLKGAGTTIVALYGATAEVHDRVTRHSGSFEEMMRGISYLKEAGVGFIAQFIPMRENYHQLGAMMGLAGSLSPYVKNGAAWLYLTASGHPERNEEIRSQRLSPREVVDLDRPDLAEEWLFKDTDVTSAPEPGEVHQPLGDCITIQRNFHIDPYGQMTFCSYVKDPSFRYDLRRGNFQEAWEKFIPSLSGRIKGEKEYWKNCGSCALKKYCTSCFAYSYLEHRKLSGKVEYLCSVARERKRYCDEWIKFNRRYYQIAGITIQVDSDLPIEKGTFHPKFNVFEVDGAGEDPIRIWHHFSTSPFPNGNARLGKKVYGKIPWDIYRRGDQWIYQCISSDGSRKEIDHVAIFNQEHTNGQIYHRKWWEENYLKGNLDSLTLFTTDQILIGRVLADREGCYLHAGGVILGGKGLLFAGHSEAGKSTMVTMLKDQGEILCDDRMIVRRWPDGFRIHGTWSHGSVPEISAKSAPLQAIYFLEKGGQNQLSPIEEPKEKIRRLLSFLIRPLLTADWWGKNLALAERVVAEIPFYRLQFDRSGEAVDLLKEVFGNE